MMLEVVLLCQIQLLQGACFTGGNNIYGPTRPPRLSHHTEAADDSHFPQESFAAMDLSY